jgi:hypothetical protein
VNTKKKPLDIAMKARVAHSLTDKVEGCGTAAISAKQTGTR